MESSLSILLLFIFTFGGSNSQRQRECSRLEYDRCVKIADPLVKEAHLVFPDNPDDIDLVCRTWNKFVDCLKRYTDKCFTDQQRRQFNKAVENPIESVHQMCMQPHYQKEYLQYAPCIKSTITEKSHCGPQYNLLVEQVAQGEVTSKETLCCSHNKFKQCVQRETRRLCDRGIQDGPAARFSSQILEKALSFLQEQCINYIPNSGDCMNDFTGYADHVMISTAPSEVYPWSTIQENNNVAGKEIPPARLAPPPPPRPSTTWIPSASASVPPVYLGVNPSQPPPTRFQPDNNFQTDPTTQILGSRTRPASYGRSSSWADTPTQGIPSISPSINNGLPKTEVVYSSTSPKPDWATMSTWNVVNHNSAGMESSPEGERLIPSTQETWYPAAGNQLSNEVDEPNQQGLSYHRNGAEEKPKQLISLTLVAAALTTTMC